MRIRQAHVVLSSMLEHILRHSAAARMIRTRWPPKAVQQVLGHASASFTLTVYGHMFDDDLDALEQTSRCTSAVRVIGTSAE